MSYILDALRKAESERERGSVPGLHAQPTPPPPAPARRDRRIRWWLTGGAVALLALAVVAGLALRAPPKQDDKTDLVAVAPAAPAPPPRTAQPAQATQASPVSPVLPTAAAPIAVPEIPALPTPALRLAPPISPASTAAITAATTAASTPATPSAQAAPPASAASGGAQTRIYAIKELPDDIRRQLPALTLGGAMYSQDAASRMLIIGGQVMHEHDALAPDHVLEQIRLKSAVLRYKGWRYSIDY